MTENGTFIINGTERVIVSQLHRSPGVFFSQPEKGLFAAQIIPYRGSWVEFEYDAKNLLHVRIDRKRKFLASVFLRALGMKRDDEILKRLLQVRPGPSSARDASTEGLPPPGGPTSSPRPSSGPRTPPASARRSSTPARRSPRRQLQRHPAAGRPEIEITEADLEGAFSVSDIVDPRTGEVVLEGNEALSPRVLSVILAEGSQIRIRRLLPRARRDRPMMSMTVKKDTIKTPEEALIEIYRRMRPGDPPTLDSSRNLFEGMFLNPQKYDFSRVGRLKLNTKLGLSTPLTEKILHLEDIKAVIAFLLKLRRNPARTSTTSTTSATAACAASASCSRTSSASASSAWSARSRKR